VSLNGETLRPGDGAAIGPGEQLLLRGVEDGELVLWDLPAVVDGRDVEPRAAESNPIDRHL
jgi:hypothetical protein